MFTRFIQHVLYTLLYILLYILLHTFITLSCYQALEDEIKNGNVEVINMSTKEGTEITEKANLIYMPQL